MDEIRKGQLNDIWIVFSDDSENKLKSLAAFKGLLVEEKVRHSSEQLFYFGAIQFYINEEETKISKKKHKVEQVDIKSIVEKYSKEIILERVLNCINRMHLNLVFLDQLSFAKFDDLQQLEDILISSKVENIKNVILMENVQEWVNAQNLSDSKIKVSGEALRKWLLQLQMLHGIDHIQTKSEQETLQVLIRCIDSTIQVKYQKEDCLFRDQGGANLERAQLAGITNHYQIIWIGMLMSINGVSEEKAISIVLKYPSIKKLLSSYQLCTLEERVVMLADIQVRGKGKKLGNKISQRIYQFFTTNDPKFQFFQ